MVREDINSLLKLGFSSMQEVSVCLLMPEGPISIAEIAVEENRHKTSVTRNLLRLIDKKMVEKVDATKEQDQDGKGRPTKYLYQLSPRIADDFTRIVTDKSNEASICNGDRVF